MINPVFAYWLGELAMKMALIGITAIAVLVGTPALAADMPGD
jgi:hypothetical protein